MILSDSDSDSDADNTDSDSDSDSDENHNNHSTTGIGKPICLVNPVRDSSFIGFTGIPCPELIGELPKPDLLTDCEKEITRTTKKKC